MRDARTCIIYLFCVLVPFLSQSLRYIEPNKLKKEVNYDNSYLYLCYSQPIKSIQSVNKASVETNS